MSTPQALQVIDPSHKSQDASDSTVHHFLPEMCTHVHISGTKWCIVGYETDTLWDLSTEPSGARCTEVGTGLAWAMNWILLKAINEGWAAIGGLDSLLDLNVISV